MSDKLVCPVCGEPTNCYMGNYRKDKLCKKHAAELKIGKIVKCDKCGEWHYNDVECSCMQPVYTELPVSGFDKCVICGANTKGYAFCRKCYNKYEEEELFGFLNKSIHKKEVCSTECNTNDNMQKIESIERDNQNHIIIIDSESKGRCITCGRQTSGMLFCTSCYHKYKNKELLFRVTNCTSIERIDDFFEGRYTCKDGHVVKSKSERDIDNYLFEHGISHAYERELAYGASEKEVLHPDFYLPNYLGENKDVYIEHWGYNENNINYTKTKKFKMPIYEKLGITLICTYEQTDMQKIDSVLDRKLNKSFIKENEING